MTNQLPLSGEWRWYWVTADEDDLRQNIHIYINTPEPNGQPVGWQKFSSKTCLGEYAKKIVDANFSSSQYLDLHHEFGIVRDIAENLDYDRLTEAGPWRYICNDQNGPFMIVQSVHRQLACYVHYFIWRRREHFEPISKAVCAISKKMVGDFEKVPELFCNE